MNNIQVLFRESLAEEEEFNACSTLFETITQRSNVKANSLVIPRYSALPFYKEFEEDVRILGGRLINSYQQHRYVADIKNWYEDLKHVTPKTWFDLSNVPKDGGPFIVKGETNSKKHNWTEQMYAKDKSEAIRINFNLHSDMLIGQQSICTREFVELENYGDSVIGSPISEEYRVFVLNGEILSKAFYWSEHIDYIKDNFTKNEWPNINKIPDRFLEEIIEIVSPNINFFVIDVAITKSKEWIVIELNDGSQSGLSCTDPWLLYKRMYEILHVD